MMDSKVALNATQAVIIDKAFQTLVAEQEVVVVDEMVASFRSGTLTFEKAVAYVARIDQMRVMENLVESRARREIAKVTKDVSNV